MLTMPVPWRSSTEAFADMLRRHGVDPSGVTDVDAAWRAFGEFLQLEVDGLDPRPESDADGFIVQWGRNSWNNGQLSLTLTRQLAVADGPDLDDPYWQPEYWQLELTMCFDDEPSLIGLDTLEIQDTDFDFGPVGPGRAAALAEMRADMERYPQLRAALAATPVRSSLSLERAG